MPSLTDGRPAHEAPTTGTRPGEGRGRDAPNARVSGIDAILPNLSFTNLFVAASRAEPQVAAPALLAAWSEKKLR
jgi:hypothetical protein